MSFPQPCSCCLCFLLQQKTIMEPISAVLTGITGGLKLFSGIKGLFGGDDDAQRYIDNARAAEQAWYRRNYYNDYLNSSMARAAIKRVEETLSKNARRNRAYAAIGGATPEYSLAASAEGLRSMDGLMTNLAAAESDRRRNADLQHLNNLNSIGNSEMSLRNTSRQQTDADLLGGLSLIADAVKGAKWGVEKKTVDTKQQTDEKQGQ